MVINSNQDTIQADQSFTLREALALLNGQLQPDQLSPAERQQITPNQAQHQLEFQLPIGISAFCSMPSYLQLLWPMWRSMGVLALPKLSFKTGNLPRLWWKSPQHRGANWAGLSFNGR